MITTTMVEEMKKYLNSLLTKVDGLLCILISDRDGVPILKVNRPNFQDNVLRPSFLSTFGMATEQANKLGLGRNNSIVCMYSKHQVIHINKLPMVITFILNSDSNTGQIFVLVEQINPLLDDLRGAIIET